MEMALADMSSSKVTVGSSGSEWNGNFTSNSTAPTGFFAVPGPGAPPGQISFVSNSTSDVVTSGWLFYGHVAILENSDGSWLTLFYATPTDVTGVWTLSWNETDTTTSAVPVTLKDSPPSTTS
jgi:hypothetical protein